MLFKAYFKEKVFAGTFEGEDDWETSHGWDDKIEAPNLAEALETGERTCRELEEKALAREERIKVSCEITIGILRRRK